MYTFKVVSKVKEQPRIADVVYEEERNLSLSEVIAVYTKKLDAKNWYLCVYNDKDLLVYCSWNQCKLVPFDIKKEDEHV